MALFVIEIHAAVPSHAAGETRRAFLLQRVLPRSVLPPIPPKGTSSPQVFGPSFFGIPVLCRTAEPERLLVRGY